MDGLYNTNILKNNTELRYIQGFNKNSKVCNRYSPISDSPYRVASCNTATLEALKINLTANTLSS